MLLFIISLSVSLSLSLPPAPHFGGDGAEREQKPSGVQLNVCRMLGADWPFRIWILRETAEMFLSLNIRPPQARLCWERSCGVIRAHHSAWYLRHETPPDPCVSSRELPLHHITDVNREGRCPERYYSPRKEAPLINDLKDEGMVTSPFPREAPCIVRHHSGWRGRARVPRWALSRAGGISKRQAAR